MKKVFSVVCLALVMQAASSQGAQEELEDGVAITFFPIHAKADKLVAVELVTSSRYKDRYLALETAVFRNDWRPVLFGGKAVNPGKCTVMVISGGYDVSCWLRQKNTEERNRKQVKTVEEIIVLVGAFSKKRLM